MAGAACPACGVAVVPGYVRCPKCHRALPRFERNISSTIGGTALVKRGSPIAGVAIAAVVGGGFIAFFALRGGKKSHAAAAPALAATTPEPPAAVAAAPAPLPALAPITTTPAPVAATLPNSGAIASQLQRRLERLELWSTVSVTGARVELQSGSCRDPQLEKQLAAVDGSFKAAGLTRIRCVEQSGAVVFDREL